MSARTRLAVALAGVAVVVAGCGTSGTAESAAHSHDAPASVSTVKGRYSGINLAQPYKRPAFTLTDQDGASFDFGAATRGQPTLLFFGYTNCPDVCPTTMADIAVALRQLDPAVAKKVQVVFVTTDPKRDSAAVLGQWLDRFDADLPARFIGLTGAQKDVDAAQEAAGVPVAQDEGQTHSALLLLYGPDDQAHVAFDAGNSAQDIRHDLQLVMGAA